MSRDPDSHRQSELDKEQAVVDLDQSIADREQARVDRDQEPLDAAQEALDVVAPKRSKAGARVHARRTTDLALAQERHDAHQGQLDDVQRAQGVRQDVLDDQQASLLEGQPDASPGDVEEVRTQAAEELQEALRNRAEEALLRAEEARLRAAETLRRLEASQLRRGGGE
jgi:hypothetical protein